MTFLSEACAVPALMELSMIELRLLLLLQLDLATVHLVPAGLV